MSNIFGSSPFIFMFLSNSCMFSIAFYYFGQVMDCNSKRERYASLWVHESRGCVVATRGNTTVLVPVGARIAYFRQSSLMQLYVAFRFMMTHKSGGSIIVFLISKSVEPNEEQKVLTSDFGQGNTANTGR